MPAGSVDDVTARAGRVLAAVRGAGRGDVYQICTVSILWAFLCVFVWYICAVSTL